MNLRNAATLIANYFYDFNWPYYINIEVYWEYSGFLRMLRFKLGM